MATDMGGKSVAPQPCRLDQSGHRRGRFQAPGREGHRPVSNLVQPRVLLADKGYDADFILADLQARGVAAVIPSKRNRKVQPVIDGHIYALRNLIERCFSKLKHSRRLATRYDKTADSFLGFVLIASIRLWIKHFVHTAQADAPPAIISPQRHPGRFLTERRGRSAA